MSENNQTRSVSTPALVAAAIILLILLAATIFLVVRLLSPDQPSEGQVAPLDSAKGTSQPGEGAQSETTMMGTSLPEVGYPGQMPESPAPQNGTPPASPLDPTPTLAAGQAAPVLCSGPPTGWVGYTILPGDTLFSLSQEIGASVAELQHANCLTGSTITAGDQLFLPTLPVRPAVIPDTAVPIPSPSPTATTAAEPSLAQLPSPMPTIFGAPETTGPLPSAGEEDSRGSVNLIWLVWMLLFLLMASGVFLALRSRRS